MKTQPVFVLVKDHPNEFLRHVLGVFSSIEYVKEVLAAIPNVPTSIYSIEFHYEDPPQQDELTLVALALHPDKIVPMASSNESGAHLAIPGTRTFTSFYDPSAEYITAYIKCINVEGDSLLTYLETGVWVNTTIVEPEPSEREDISDEQKEWLEKIPDFLA